MKEDIASSTMCALMDRVMSELPNATEAEYLKAALTILLETTGVMLLTYSEVVEQPVEHVLKGWAIALFDSVKRLQTEVEAPNVVPFTRS